MLASGKRLQTSGKIVDAPGVGILLAGFSRMKQNDKVTFRFLLALAGGRVFTLSNNKSAREL
jgi:hypothetical protein